jgi:uncharacterized protein YndB with AHSA1/START domain
VWRAISNLEEFSNWFGVEASGAFAPGARLRMTTTHEEYKGIVFDLTVDRMEPEHTISWRWHPGMPEAGVDYASEPTTLVEFQLKEVEGGTMVTVVESGFDQISLARRARVYQQNTEGWEEQLKNLEQYVVGSA